jgi:hypothetical protein
MGGLGPMKYGQDRYASEVNRLFGELNKRLAGTSARSARTFRISSADSNNRSASARR